MSIKENIAIKIYNYNPFVLNVTTNVRTHTLVPCYDINNPTFSTVTYSELDYYNSVSNCLRNGMVAFEESIEKEIYEALGIVNYKDILTNKTIKDILINPTKEKLSKIISTTDESVFNRVNAIYRGLVNGGQHDISNRVTNIIETRIDEFRHGILSTRIQLVAKDDSIVNDDIDSVKKQNESLQAQLNQMQEMMSMLLASQNTENTINTTSPDEIEKKKSGRKPKTSTT